MHQTRIYADQVDQEELVRRITVYLQLDMPHLNDPRAIAEALGSRLHQYVRPEPSPPPDRYPTLEALLPEDALVFFVAVWDGNSQRFRPVVEGVAAELGRRVIEVDVDDRVGGAIAAAYSVLNTPAVASGLPGQGAVIIGERDPEELARLLAK